MDEGVRPAGPVPEEDSRRSRQGARPSAPPAGEDVEQDLAELLADAEAKRDEYLELARRTQADFENFRKRMTAEVQARQRSRKDRAGSRVDRPRCTSIDSVERAIGRTAGQHRTGATNNRMGSPTASLLVFRGMRETLRRNGIERVDPKGEKFDPKLHEALSTKPPTVQPVDVEVLRGYRRRSEAARRRAPMTRWIELIRPRAAVLPGYRT